MNTKTINPVLAVLFLVMPLVFASSVAAQDELPEGGLSGDDFLRIVYSDFLTIESFGHIRVVLEGEDAEKIGLDSDKLTDFLKLRFKNNFATIQYKYQWKAIIESDDEDFQSSIGTLYVTVWIVGTDYPIAYHIEIGARAFSGDGGFENAVLGYGSKDNVEETVKTSIAGMVEELAVLFFKVRGEL